MKYKSLAAIAAALFALPTNAQIVGSWLLPPQPDSPNVAVITFLEDGTYFMAEDGDPVADPTGSDGMERGTYTWNSATGAFSKTTTVDTTGRWGLSDYPVTNVTVQGNTLRANGGEVTLTRVASAPSALVGAWLRPAANGESAIVITFLADGSFFLVEDGDPVADPGGQDGMERGTYTWNAATGAFSSNVATDTTGVWGISHFPINNVTVSGNTMVAQGAITFTKIASAPSVAIRRRSATEIQLDFVGILQSASSIDGAWADVIPQPASGVVLQTTAPRQFFRARR